MRLLFPPPFFLLFFCFVELACVNPPKHESKKIPPTVFTSKEKINGVSFVSPPRQIEQHLVSLPKELLNANALSIMPYGFIPEGSSELMYNSDRQWWGERTKGCMQLIQMAHEADYQVMLKPQVWKRGGAYTGEHDYSSEADWLAFEKSYKDFILHFAQVADSLNVAFFAIGTEWKNFVIKRPIFWKQLIRDVRAVFNGKIVYAANWDEYEEVPFWSELDYVGIDAYFPLIAEQTPQTNSLIEALQPIKKAIHRFSDSLQKQIIFTEYGYRSRNNNAFRPWESDRGGAVNLIAQENAYRAFYQTFWLENFIAGGFIWKWFPNHEQSGGENHTGFTPQNKPVEKLIKKHYN